MPPRKKTEIQNETSPSQNDNFTIDEKVSSIYGELMDLDTEDVNTFFPSGSLVLDSVLSNGLGIPIGKFISINSESGIGKCVTGNTFVCVNGVFQRIDENISELGYTEYVSKINTLNNVVETSHKYMETVKSTIKFTDKYGLCIESTQEHPFFVMHDDLTTEWVKSKNIKIGDKILGQGFIYLKPNFKEEYYKRGINIHHNRMYEPMDYDCMMSKIAGAVDSISRITLNSIKFYHKSPEVIESLQKYLSMIGIIGKRNIASDVPIYRLCLDERNTKKLALLLVDLVIKNKFRLINVLLNDNVYQQKQNLDGYSINNEKIRSIIKCVNGEKHKSLKFELYKSLKNNKLSRKLLEELFSEKITDINISNYELHEISKIENINEVKNVYDYTVPESHSFLSNGLLSHNTTLCLHVARNCCARGKRCLYIDTETGINKNQLNSFNMMQFVNNGTFLVKRVQTYRELDELFSKIVLDDELQFIFLDSLTDVIPDQLLTNNIADMNQPGLDAKYQSAFLRKYKSKFNSSGKTVFFILQNRTQIGMSYGQQTTVVASGGKAVKYHMDITLELVKRETLEKTVAGYEKPIPYGAECLIKSTKNRIAPPFIPMPIQIHFGKGVSNAGAIAKALVLNNYVKTPTKRSYIIPFEGEDVKLDGRGAFEEFVKNHLSYYKNIVENELGGIKLLKEPPQPEE